MRSETPVNEDDDDDDEDDDDEDDDNERAANCGNKDVRITR